MRYRWHLSAALLANSALPLATGLLIAVFAVELASAMGRVQALWLQVFAAMLVAHAAILGAVYRGVDGRLWTAVNLACIAPYPFLLAGDLVFATDRAVGWIDGLLIWMPPRSARLLCGWLGLGLGGRRAGWGLHERSASRAEALGRI